ncbi:MAG: transposase [Actinobacteria bacterium]|nr:transposase [Actinomycetota bacterium]
MYYSASKKTASLVKNTGKKLLVIAKKELENAKLAVNDMGNTISEFTRHRFEKLNTTGKAIISQIEAKLSGVKLPKRILSYHEENTVALPKGRSGSPCAFGTKLSLSVTSNGYITNHNLYDKNIADINTLRRVVKKHRQTFGKKFKAVSADRAYYDRHLIEEIEDKYQILCAIPHKKRKNLSMSAAKELICRKRSAIEAKISEGKRMVGLSKSYYKGFSGDRIWASLSILALNLRQLLKDFAKKPDLIYKFG